MKIGDTCSEWETIKRGVPQGSVLGPMFFNIFINDLFFNVKCAKLHAYADDEQIYDSDKDPLELDKRIQNQVSAANLWFDNNGMIANATKHQAMILGQTDHQFSFPTKDSLDLLGMTIDKELRFNDHITTICKKINNQFNVMMRFNNLISKEIMMKLYKACILPHFHYCSTVWHFCGSRNTDKLEALNKRILRYILKDKTSDYKKLLEKSGTVSLYNKRLQNMLLVVYKSLHFNDYPRYLKDLFTLRSVTYSLRGTDILALPKPLTTTYGLHSVRYLASRTWNSLPDTYRLDTSPNEFKNKIRKLNFN